MTKKHTGSCHCGAVKFEVEVDATRGSGCNCSICTKLGAIGAIAKPEAFTVIADADVTAHRWGGMTATRYFCKHCGITCYSRGNLPELGGDYVSINLRALDGVDPSTIELMHWDGRHNNWDAGPSPTPYPIHSDAARSQTVESTSPIATS
jgi:hypothetical protein